jgi:aminocarboxymuconate-semialdehyde decarboxylase
VFVPWRWAIGFQHLVGADRVVIGTDYPMAMGDFVPVNKVMQPQIGDAERAAILGGNAARALRL